MKPIEIKELYEAGTSGAKIAEMLGVKKELVYRALRLMGVPIRKRGQKQRSFYVIYDAQGDVITSGPPAECAAFLGIQIASFYSSVAPSRDKRCKARKWYAVRVEDDGDAQMDE